MNLYYFLNPNLNTNISTNKRSGYINDREKVDKSNNNAFQDMRDVFVFYWNAFQESSKTLAGDHEFHNTCKQFFYDCDSLATKLLSVYSSLLGQEPSFFAKKHSKKRHVCLINHYYPSEEPERRRLDAHQDKGSFTLIFQKQGSEGFEVWDTKKNTWFPGLG